MSFDRLNRWSRLFLVGTVAGWVMTLAPARADDEKPMTVDEVVAELQELVPAITPFTVSYDKDGKTLSFHEVPEVADKTAPVRVAELRARLARLDATRLDYSAGVGAVAKILVQGKAIAGRVNFYCKAEQPCIARQLRLESEPRALVDGNESTFGIDIFENVQVGKVRRFADLVSNLAINAGAAAATK